MTGCNTSEQQQVDDQGVTEDIQDQDITAPEVVETVPSEDTVVTAPVVSPKRPHIDQEGFERIVKRFEELGYYLIPYGKWHRSYRSDLDKQHDEIIYVYKSNKHIWRGMSLDKVNVYVKFADVEVNEVVIKQKQVNKAGYRPSVKIFRFRFIDEDIAAKNLYRVTLISNYILSTDGLNNPNDYWMHGSSIFLFQIRAAAFDPQMREVMNYFSKYTYEMFPLASPL